MPAKPKHRPKGGTANQDNVLNESAMNESCVLAGVGDGAQRSILVLVFVSRVRVAFCLIMNGGAF